MAVERKSFIIRVDIETLAAIEKWAADEFRSTNGQIEWILWDALKRVKREPRRQPEDTATKNTIKQ